MLTFLLFHLVYLVQYQSFLGMDIFVVYPFENGTSIVDLWFLFKQQGLSDVRRGGRRARVVSANKPSSRPSKRNSEKKKVCLSLFSVVCHFTRLLPYGEFFVLNLLLFIY